MIEIRKATPNDMEQVLDMRYTTIKSVCNLHKEHIFDRNFQDCTRAYYENADQTTVLAWNDKVPIGCATICYILLMPTFDHPSGKRAHIMNVYVDKKYRRQGIALKMMEMLMDEAKEKGVTEISLDATEEGCLLYEQLGFKTSTEGMVLEIQQY